MAGENLLKMAEQKFQSAAENIAKDLIATCYKEQQTNADRIRAMSDKELKYIARAVIKSEDCPMGETECKGCVFHDLCLRGDYYYYYNEEEWLKQPVED